MRALEATAFGSGISEAQLQANAASAVARRRSRAGAAWRFNRGRYWTRQQRSGRISCRPHPLLSRAKDLQFLAPRHAIESDELVDGSGRALRAAVFETDESVQLLEQELSSAALCIDGLLGIGVRGPMRAPLDLITASVNRVARESSLRVLSVDVPSGIDADSGQIAAEAIQADVTVALGGVKAGCLRFPGAELVGRIEPRAIGLPPGADADCNVRILDRQMVRPLVPTRPLNAHKASLGWVLVVGGSREYVGAPILSSSAAARSGCGLVALAVTENVQSPAAVALPEATYLLREDSLTAAEQAARIGSRAASFEALVLGPGLGRAEHEVSLVQSFLTLQQRGLNPLPTIIDADALYALSVWKEFWTALPTNCVLTPHHGEMSRLTGRDSSEIAQLNWELAIEYSTLWRQVVVLKGSNTTVADPDGKAWVFPSPNPGLATAGSGDVLAGLVGGLAAQGLAPVDAARLAVVTHALAAKSLLDHRGWRSLIASDLLPILPEGARRAFSGARPAISRRYRQICSLKDKTDACWASVEVGR